MLRVPNKAIYLDYASTTPIATELLHDVDILLKEYYQNADSYHFGGQRVSDLVEASRHELAKVFGILPHEIIFTSGASESNNAALKGIAFANQAKGKHIITTQIEHSSIMEACRQLETHFGFEVTYLPVNEAGVLEVEVLKQALRDDTILVSLMAVNNEIGSILDVSTLAKIVKKHSSALVHVDGVQALAKHDFSLQQIDSVAFSAHKIHGLKGSGLWIKRDHVKALPLISGGQQEHGMRGGTLDSIPAILWAKTYRLARETHVNSIAHIQMLRNLLETAFRNQEGIVINSPVNGSPYIFNMSVLNVGSEIMMNGLARAGYEVSAQSTCHSKSLAPSPVLKAIRADDKRALSSVRISLSHEVTQADIENVIEKIWEIKNYVQHER